MKKTALSVILLTLGFNLAAQAFWAKAIYEVRLDCSDEEMILSLEEGKKYRIKFYNLDTDAKRVNLIAENELADKVDVRTKDIRVKKQKAAFHVIDIKKADQAFTGFLKLEDENGEFVQRVRVLAKKRMSCSPHKEKQCGFIEFAGERFIMEFRNSCDLERAGAKTTECL